MLNVELYTTRRFTQWIHWQRQCHLFNCVQTSGAHEATTWLQQRIVLLVRMHPAIWSPCGGLWKVDVHVPQYIYNKVHASGRYPTMITLDQQILSVRNYIEHKARVLKSTQALKHLYESLRPNI